jgi:hypothetical protein
MARVKHEVNRIYLLHIKLTQLMCFMVRRQGDEAVWHWHERFRHVRNGGPLEAGSRGASTCSTRYRLGGAVVLGVPGQKAMTHLIPDEGRVSGEMTPRAGARRLVRSNHTGDAEG